MPNPPPLPNADAVLTPLVDALVGNPAAVLTGVGNPARNDHISLGQGYWSNVVAGWKAQARLNLRRVADEMMQARLGDDQHPMASGGGLRALASAKYFVDAVDAPIQGLGQAVLQRVGTSGSQGTIYAGTRLRRNANPAAFPFALNAAEYLTLADVVVPYGTPAGAVFACPIVCTTPGAAGNILIEANALGGGGFTIQPPGTDLQIVDQVFDSFSVYCATCAGGATGFSDGDVRRICRAQPQGRRGPTLGAIYAGSFLAAGVRRAAIFEDLVLANTNAFFADAAWGSDGAFVLPNGSFAVPYWSSTVLQTLRGGTNGANNPWAGFGCSLVGGNPVANLVVDVAATIQLRSSTLLSQTQAIKDACVAALRSYFDDRNDWYVFKKLAMRARLSRAHPGILTCTSVALTASRSSPVVSLSDPVDPTTTSPAPAVLPHYYMTSFTPNFVVPA